MQLAGINELFYLSQLKWKKKTSFNVVLFENCKGTYVIVVAFWCCEWNYEIGLWAE